MDSDSVQGVDALDRAFKRLIDNLSSMRDVWPEVEREFHALEREHLDTEGHGRFAPLDDRYAMLKEREFPGQKIMQREGELYLSLTERAGDTIDERTDTELTLGTNRRGAASHMRPQKNRPARPPIDEEGIRERIPKVLNRAMLRKAKEANESWVQEKTGDF